MSVETLHFESARRAQQLFNNDPRNLQALDHQLGVKATSREGWIKLEGDADAIDRAKHLFLLLENSLQAGTPVRNRGQMRMRILRQIEKLGKVQRSSGMAKSAEK